MGDLFGTDGIRGVADDAFRDLARDVGRAVARACREGLLASADRPRVVIGRDTRPSGPEIEAAVTEGLAGAGADVVAGGVLPTPAVAYLVAATGADAGIVISASHNPPQDNGLKVFGPGGWKLTLEAEDHIERLVASPGTGAPVPGTVETMADAFERYVDHLAGSVSGDLGGLRVVVDCANGAASRAAPAALARLGVDVVALNCDGDGSRINDGSGAVHPEVVAAAARERSCIGLTFDGDADRVLACDETGEIVDGDGIMALVAADLRAHHALAGDAIACTVMSNQALRRWCGTEGIRVIETPVGDRHVLGAMRAHGLVLGGEQAGHVIRLDRSTTGDGILLGLGVLDVVARAHASLRELVPFRPMPQVLVNVRTQGAVGLDGAPGVREAVGEVERKLGGEGRVLVRPSGTEPVVRVMVEAPDERVAGELAEFVATAVRRDLNGEA